MPNYTFVEVMKLSLLDVWTRMISVLPELIGAVIIIVIGLLVAPLLGRVVKKVVSSLGVDKASESLGVTENVQGFIPNFSIAGTLGALVKWFFLIVFIMAAVEMLRWETVTIFLNEILLYIPQVLIAVVILVAGVMVGTFMKGVVVRALEGSKAPVSNPEMLGSVAKWAFTIFALLAALIQLGITPMLIQILFAGVVLALALAFGLGGQKKAAEILDRIDAKK